MLELFCPVSFIEARANKLIQPEFIHTLFVEGAVATARRLLAFLMCYAHVHSSLASREGRRT